MGWLDWLASGISHIEHTVGSGISYVEHLIFPNKNTHITSNVSSNVYTKYTEVPKKKVTIPNLELTTTAKKSLEEVKKGEIPSYIPKPEISSSPIATKEGVYTPYGYFRNSTDYTKYLIWKFPDTYFPDIFKSDKELYNLYYLKHDYEGARELFRRKYSNLIRQAVSNPEIVKGIEWGSITHLKVENGKIIPVNIESEILPSMRRQFETTHPTIVSHIPPNSIPKPVTEVTPPKFGLISTNIIPQQHILRANAHVTVTPEKVTTKTAETKTVGLETKVSTLSEITKTVIPVMSAVLAVLIVKKIISEVRV